MLAAVGFYLLLLCFVTSLYGGIASIVSAHQRHRRLFRSSRMASLAVSIMAAAASVVLFVLLFNRDYSVKYVYDTTSNDLPTLYRITAFWSSLAGSHLLWALMLTVSTTICLFRGSLVNEHIMPYVSASLQIVLAWMFYLSVMHSDPFAVDLMPRSDGSGMNPLLQNPYIAIHPPILFLGYATLGVPFAYAMAALCYGDVTDGWLVTARRWTLASWIFLTAGIFLGGRWAYVELGWAGYWAWDPVENSSLMPWILVTALLHSFVVQDKIGHLKRTTVILAIVSFFFCFFGTFITRSGIISSVHSFAASPLGPNYLLFLSVLMVLSLLVYGYRSYLILPPEPGKAWGVSKESSIVLGLFLLLAFALIVFLGTVYPLVADAVSGQRPTIQAPYFNQFMPWIGVLILVVMTFGNLMRYSTGRVPMKMWIWSISTVLAVPIGIGLVYGAESLLARTNFQIYAQVIGIFLCVLSFNALTCDLVLRLLNSGTVARFFKRHLAFVGGYVAHVGVLMAIFGFLGNYHSDQKIAAIDKGETTSLGSYEFKYDKLEMRNSENAMLMEAHIELSKDGQLLDVLTPARSKYQNRSDTLHEVSVRSAFFQDIYVTISKLGMDGGKSTFEFNIKRTVVPVWIAAILLCLGGAICLLDRRRGLKSRDVVRGTDVA